jgi:acyl-CoA synthetase (AMP-forming)/AMP-acid ligase II
LNEKAEILAAHLQKNFNIGKNSAVAICMDKCPEVIISMMGILKAGGKQITSFSNVVVVVLSLPPTYPAYIINHANTMVLYHVTFMHAQLAMSPSTLITLETASKSCWRTVG